MTLEELRARVHPEDAKTAKAIAAAAPLPGPELAAKLRTLLSTSVAATAARNAA